MNNKSLKDYKSNMSSLLANKKKLIKDKLKIDKEILNAQSELIKVKSLYDKAYIEKNGLSFEEKLQFLLTDDEFGTSKYSEKLIAKMFEKHLKGLSVLGKNEYNNQKKINIDILNQNDCDFEEIEKNVMSILNIIKPANEEGDKLFSLIDKNISIESSPHIKISTDNVWSLISRGNNLIKSFDTLLEVLIYCDKNYQK